MHRMHPAARSVWLGVLVSIKPIIMARDLDTNGAALKGKEGYTPISKGHFCESTSTGTRRPKDAHGFPGVHPQVLAMWKEVLGHND